MTSKVLCVVLTVFALMGCSSTTSDKGKKLEKQKLIFFFDKSGSIDSTFLVKNKMRLNEILNKLHLNDAVIGYNLHASSANEAFINDSLTIDEKLLVEKDNRRDEAARESDIIEAKKNGIRSIQSKIFEELEKRPTGSTANHTDIWAGVVRLSNHYNLDDTTYRAPVTAYFFSDMLHDLPNGDNLKNIAVKTEIECEAAANKDLEKHRATCRGLRAKSLAGVKIYILSPGDGNSATNFRKYEVYWKTVFVAMGSKPSDIHFN